MRWFPKRIDCAGGPGRRALFVLFACLSCALPISAQPGDKRITAIERLSRQINEQISESERVEEGNGIYCNELVINKGDKSWPAVGIFRTVIKFYYTFGNREKNPYPDQLLKITVTTHRSDRREYAEYVFNSAAQLIYHYQKDGESAESEQRCFFAAGRLLRLTKGKRIVGIRSREAVETATRALDARKSMLEIFVKSLRN
ncbi:MAG TPA: hypothetical protein VNO50_18085 [Pyrinomonadaceae bacterium]|nr:hypothetical protein [Pyrinomonadaceae bacterium]